MIIKMSRKRLCLKIFSIAAIVISALFLILTMVSGIMMRSSGDGTLHISGTRLAAIDISTPDYPRGSLVGLMQGSIPENTPVAVRMDGITVLTNNQLTKAGNPPVSREQILGGVSWSVHTAGWIFILTETIQGLLFCLLIPVLIIGLATFLLLRYGQAAGSFGSYSLPQKGKKHPAAQDGTPLPEDDEKADPFPELDYRLKPQKTAVSPAVKTVVITQTRPASSAIRNQKGEVRIYASGQEKVLPLNTGKRVVNIGGYNITVDIAREQPRTEDVTRELSVIKRELPGKQDMDDTQKIEIVGKGNAN